MTFFKDLSLETFFDRGGVLIRSTAIKSVFLKRVDKYCLHTNMDKLVVNVPVHCGD